MKTKHIPAAWEKSLASDLKNLKGWYVAQNQTMTQRLWQSLYKEVFALWQKHAPEPEYPAHDFMYIIHPSDTQEDVWNMDWYVPGGREGSFQVYKNYCGIIPIDELDSHKFYKYERVGACPLQLSSTHHHNLVAKLLKDETRTTALAIVLRIPKSKPYERAFKNGVVPEGYFELIPFICAIKPW